MRESPFATDVPNPLQSCPEALVVLGQQVSWKQGCSRSPRSILMSHQSYLGRKAAQFTMPLASITASPGGPKTDAAAASVAAMAVQWSRAAHLAAAKTEVATLAKDRPLNGVISIAGDTEQNVAVSLLPFVMAEAPHRKLITVPSKPSLDELTLRLKFDALPGS